MAANTWFEQLRFGVAKVLDAAGAELPWRGRLRFAAPFVVSDDTDYQASLVEVDAPALLRSGSDTLATVSVPADAGEGWVTLWSETRLALATTDGDARDIRHHLAVAGDEAIDIASMVWQYQRTDDGVLGDAIVNKDAEELAPDGTTGVEWELTLPVADSTIATRAIRIADDVAVQAQAHATIDRVVTIRTYYGPIVNGPYEIGVII